MIIKRANEPGAIQRKDRTNLRTSSAVAKPPRWLSWRRRMSSASGSVATAACAASSGTMWSASPCHHLTGAFTSASRKPQSRPKRRASSTIAPTEHWELPAAARHAMEPQHRRSGRVAVFGIARAAPVGKVKAALRARLFDARHAEWVAPRVIRTHSFRAAIWRRRPRRCWRICRGPPSVSRERSVVVADQTMRTEQSARSSAAVPTSSASPSGWRALPDPTTMSWTKPALPVR
jgi:hypothetical protein